MAKDKEAGQATDYSDKTKTAAGLFGLQGIMEEFYGYQPKADDDEGRALKNAFSTNMIQSAFNDLQATGMAYKNAEIASNAVSYTHLTLPTIVEV